MLRRLLALVCCAALAGGCAAHPEALPPTMEDRMRLEGPLASTDRTAAPWTVDTTNAGVRVVRVDFGNVTAGDYAAPARGMLVLPADLSATAPAPVVVLSHLRAPTCADLSFAYPCPEGVTELRYDEGWLYLAEALAARGYVAVLPDLGPAFIASYLTEPYDQEQMWSEIVGHFLAYLRGEDSDAGDRIDLGIAGAADVSEVSLVAHSRSAMMAGALGRLVGQDNVRGVLTYGGSYDVYDLEAVTPAPADVPLLAVEGDRDADVGRAPSMWLATATRTARSQPALALQLGGLGHMGINTTAVAAGVEDRTGCDIIACLPDEQAQQAWVEVTTAWLDATTGRDSSSLPLGRLAALPREVAGRPATWLALSTDPALRVGAGEFTGNAGAEFSPCQPVDPMNPAPPAGACPLPERGVVEAIAEGVLTTGAHAQVPPTPARMVAVHLAPFGDAPSGAVEVAVELTLSSGTVVPLSIPVADPAVAVRANAESNGVYGLRTVRIALPEVAVADPVAGVRVVSNHPILLRGLDLLM